MFGADAEGDFLVFLRDIKRPEQPIPYRQRKAEVLVEMARLVGMMDLVMSRTLEEPAGHAREGDPHMRMAQMPDRHDEKHQHEIGVEQSEGADSRSKQIGHRAEDDACAQR